MGCFGAHVHALIWGAFFVLFLNSMRVSPFPSAKPPLPARPAGGRAVTGVRYRAAGQAEKREDPLQGPKNQSRESRGEKLSPLALFPPVSREKRGPRRVGALRGAAPRGWSKPRPPEGYAVPHRSPARDRAGTHVAGLDLRWSQRNHLPTAPPPKAVQGTGPAGPIPAPVSAYLTVLPPARWRTGSLAPPIPPGAGKTLSPRCSGR